MNVVYEPRGRAREYSELAYNLYRGCTHGCRYCYAPACMRACLHATHRPGGGLWGGVGRMINFKLSHHAEDALVKRKIKRE